MKVLYQYLTGPEFKNRVEGIVDAFTGLQEELEKEKDILALNGPDRKRK